MWATATTAGNTAKTEEGQIWFRECGFGYREADYLESPRRSRERRRSEWDAVGALLRLRSLRTGEFWFCDFSSRATLKTATASALQPHRPQSSPADSSLTLVIPRTNLPRRFDRTAGRTASPARATRLNGLCNTDQPHGAREKRVRGMSERPAGTKESVGEACGAL